MVILSASRRTDIPALYSGWFFNRIDEGFAMVRNPMNKSQVRTVPLAPELVDCIVFWTKNPKPMMPHLDKLTQYNYYFQFTLNPYDNDIETNLPKKPELVDTFKELSEKLGASQSPSSGHLKDTFRVIWRYDPILLNEKYTVAYHVENFGKMAHALKGYTEKVTISFVDFYSKIEHTMSNLNVENINSELKHEIAQQFSAIARDNSLIIDACAEDIDLSCYDIPTAHCIDGNLIQRITGKTIGMKKDRSQRKECGCVAAVDIGAYNTCTHGCLYCYANHDRSVVMKNIQNHDEKSPLLIGEYSIK